MRLLLAALMLIHIVDVNSALAHLSMAGKVVTNVGDVGEHYPLFFIEKSHHPENITVVYTKLDTDCRVLPDRAHDFLPTLDFYWLMDTTRYKPMAALLKAGVRKRLQFVDGNGYQDNLTAFTVRTDELPRVQRALQNLTMQVKAERRGEVCEASAFMAIGSSNGHTTLKVEAVSIQTAPMTLLKTMRAMTEPDVIQIDAVTVKGTDITTGQPLERTYHATE